MRRQPTSRDCFICGRRSPVGLKMSFFSTGPGQVVAEQIVPDVYQGYPGVVHGGITAAMLDETAGRAIIAAGDDHRFFMTLKLEVRYRRQVPTKTPLTVVGQLTSMHGRRAAVHGEIRLPDGTVAAEADALLIEMPAQMLEGVDLDALGWSADDA